MQTTHLLNADTSELEKFSALASRWWDPESEFKPLHQINPLRLQWIIEQAGSLQQKNILDVGCGGGLLSESMAKQGAKVLGIDLAEKSLQTARLHALETATEVNYQLISVEELAQTHAGQFDIVTCMEMLEHVPDPSSIIRACSQLVKPGGYVFFSSINRNIKSFLLAIVGAEYVLNMVPKGTHQYEKLLKPSEIARFSRQASMIVTHIAGIEYQAFSKNFSITQNASVNYMMVTQRS